MYLTPALITGLKACAKMSNWSIILPHPQALSNHCDCFQNQSPRFRDLQAQILVTNNFFCHSFPDTQRPWIIDFIRIGMRGAS